MESLILLEFKGFEVGRVVFENIQGDICCSVSMSSISSIKTNWYRLNLGLVELKEERGWKGIFEFRLKGLWGRWGERLDFKFWGAGYNVVKIWRGLLLPWHGIAIQWSPVCTVVGGATHLQLWGGEGCLTPVICHAAADGEGVRTNGSRPSKTATSKSWSDSDMKQRDTLLRHHVALKLRYAASQRWCMNVFQNHQLQVEKK